MQERNTVSENRKTYPQNWAAYNAAQTTEKEHFLNLLHALCLTIKDPLQTNGRPRLPISDALFSICYKIYSTVSGRRFMSDLRDAQEKGFIKRTPHFNSLFNYLENPELTPILKRLIIETSLPLATIEQDFAADSSGFTSSTYVRWRDCKYGKKKLQQWCKVHLMCGIKTNIVTAVEIHGKNASDCPQLPDLLKATANNFSIRDVSADKAYSSFGNHATVNYYGGTPFIAFKENAKPYAGGLWEKMFYYFKFNQVEFMKHYNKRSNVETAFAMIKAKFGGYVRSKTEISVKNEVLCKIICHNICVLIQESHELGIDVSFKNEFGTPN